jgi:hypothetical protein
MQAGGSLGGMFTLSRVNLMFAHWFAGKKKRHRYNREKRYHYRTQMQASGRNNFSRKLYWKSNRWNYTAAYKDMP